MNAWHCLVFSFLLLEGVRAQGVNLGKLHWCNTLCLCDDDTLEQRHCFTSPEIYSLMQVEEKKVQRLTRLGFVLEEKFMWCSETCLCHKIGKKEFRCTDKVRLGEFINERAPYLSVYLEQEVEIFDARDIIDREDEAGSPVEVDEAEDTPTGRKDRHKAKKARKHRKNRKKDHRKHEDVTELPMSSTLSSTAEVDAVTDNPQEERRPVHSAGIFSGGSAPSGDYDPPSTRSTEGGSHTPLMEVPHETRTVAGRVANKLEELRSNVDTIRDDVTFNQQIMLITLVIAAIAMIGVLILAIYLCCVRKSTKKMPISPPNSSLRQDTNNVTKVNLEGAW